MILSATIIKFKFKLVLVLLRLKVEPLWSSSKTKEGTLHRYAETMKREVLQKSSGGLTLCDSLVVIVFLVKQELLCIDISLSSY